MMSGTDSLSTHKRRRQAWAAQIEAATIEELSQFRVHLIRKIAEKREAQRRLRQQDPARALQQQAAVAGYDFSSLIKEIEARKR
ncbi:hypothetical protein QCD60_29910 [Pokkaliibacter sp. MBI-7]|uniref:hypothetical protein n=1 Tax=Pokkaliibacter sp. MBI-7 TaxID=3040600 RepID=UPI002449F3BC|nr:hypothetical protein [Pokkaliibacter sp. MBI-7]MDH2431036.1 hypothetical protein [Pokkaliibacter sp. MBI-7]MDH2436731.1 hypothetical protein [Pokkaliibacter sp. MBI-7]